MPIMIRTEEKHTIPAQATRIIHASITVSNDRPINGTIQPLPQFDENSKLNVASAKTTARVAIKIARTTDSPYTITLKTKLTELQTVKPEEPKSIRPVNLAAINLLNDHDDVVAYVNASMQVDSSEKAQRKLNSGLRRLKMPDTIQNIHQSNNASSQN